MSTEGLVLDIYDDPSGRILSTKLGGSRLPAKIASSRLLEPAELLAMPDRLFALVAEDGDHWIRKYAMHDAGHLATSILYFMSCGGGLDEDTRSKVAANLVNACAWYDLDPPDSLVKTALLGAAMQTAVAGMGAVDLTHRARGMGSRNQMNQESFRAAQVSGSKVADGGHEIELSAAEDHRVQITGESSGYVDKALKSLSDRDVQERRLYKQLQDKIADLNGTEIMPYGATSRSSRSNPSKNVAVPAKTSAGKLAALHIAEGWQPSEKLMAPEPIKTATRGEHFALPHRGLYPIDTAQQIKTATRYFDEHVKEFSLLDRRTYALCLTSRAEDLDVKVAGAVMDYAGLDYGSHITAELNARARSTEGTGHDSVYSLLLEKRAEIPPYVMVEMLKDADAITGVDRSYGRPGVGMLDPYRAVYGVKAAMEDTLKIEEYSWSQGPDYVNGFMLSALATTGANLDLTFGDGFTLKFRKDPVGMFGSLPDPQKVVLSRIASDNSGTTFNI